MKEGNGKKRKEDSFPKISVLFILKNSDINSDTTIIFLFWKSKHFALPQAFWRKI